MEHTIKHIITKVKTTSMATLCLLTAALTASCNGEHEEIISTWPNGKPQLVYKVKGSGDNKVKTGECRYYESGHLHSEKHYAGQESTPTGVWKYYYDNEKMFARGDFDAQHPKGDKWEFYTQEGKRFGREGSDSVRVVELNEYETPATVCYYHKNVTDYYQFYSNYALRSEGSTIDGNREGKWVFYHPNGNVQTDATFKAGKEEGTYTVYRENGIPFYRGMYHEGKRTGTWEIYDEKAELLTTKQY